MPRPSILPLLALGALVSLSCDDGASPDPGVEPLDEGSATRQLVLANFATAVFVPATERFAERADALSAAADAWASVDGAPGAEREAARDAWRAAMSAWQYNEVLRAGPAGAERNYVGGLGLRDRIYSWPTSRPCGVDQNLVAERYAEADFTTAQLVNVLGLDALEYLLFYDGPENDCPSQVEINLSGSWEALGDTEVNRRRSAYAAVVARQVAADGAALRSAWAFDGGDFAGQLDRAGGDDSVYGTTREALEQVFHGMFYLDQAIKDLKLAVPTALSVDCASPAGCPGDLESPWAGHARQNLAANMLALRDLFTGGEGDALGFDDLLDEAGAGELSAEMLAAIDASIADFEGETPALDALIADDLTAAQALHTRVKTITDLMKSQFVVVLDLNVPASGAADND